MCDPLWWRPECWFPAMLLLLRPADRETPMGALSLWRASPSTCPYKTFSCLSLTHQNQQQPFSAALISPADGVAGLAPLWACSVIRLLILIFLLFLSYLRSLRMNGGESRWRALDRVPLGDRGWGPFPAVSFLRYLLERRSRRIPPSLSGCHSAPSIWLRAQPPPREAWPHRHTAAFVEGDPPVETDSRQRW